MRFPDFYRYVFNEAVPRASALAVFRLFAHDDVAEELSFEHFLLGIAVLTLADEHERRGGHRLLPTCSEQRRISAANEHCDYAQCADRHRRLDRATADAVHARRRHAQHGGAMFVL
jgi:hypothetical protein